MVCNPKIDFVLNENPGSFYLFFFTLGRTFLLGFLRGDGAAVTPKRPLPLRNERYALTVHTSFGVEEESFSPSRFFFYHRQKTWALAMMS